MPQGCLFCLVEGSWRKSGVRWGFEGESRGGCWGRERLIAGAGLSPTVARLARVVWFWDGRA
jgi:hypothetical protein